MEHRPVGDAPRNPHVHHEPGDVNAIFLTKFGIGMALMIAVFLFGLWGVFSYFNAREAKLGQAAVPVRTTRQIPPEPRLQADPAADLEHMRADEERLLHQYAWIDPDKGIVRIPVERAMELVVQRGLPATASTQTPGKRP